MMQFSDYLSEQKKSRQGDYDEGSAGLKSLTEENALLRGALKKLTPLVQHFAVTPSPPEIIFNLDDFIFWHHIM